MIIKTLLVFLLFWVVAMLMLIGFKVIVADKGVKRYFLEVFAYGGLSAIIAITVLFFIVQLF